MIDSTYSNRLFQELLLNRKVPGIEEFSLIKREPVYGNHRFDFLIENNGEQRYLELKSCTLFHERVASFPDAVSDRASGHVRLLSESGKGIIVFFILKNNMKYFIPNYHTDFTFYETLKRSRDKLEIKALSVDYNNDLEIKGLREVPVLIPEVTPGGIFILLYKQGNSADSESYILLCGKDKSDVFSRVKKLRNSRNNFPSVSGVDFNSIKIISSLPVISNNITLPLLDSLLSNKENQGRVLFSSEEWRIYLFRENPAEQQWFWDEILKLRYNQYL